MRYNRKKTFLIMILCTMMVFMGIGYATFTQKLSVSSTATIDSTWSVRIKSIDYKTEGYADVKDNTPTILNDGVSAKLITKLLAPNDSITYTITVKNEGTIKAILKNIEYSNDTSTEYLKIRDTITSSLEIEPNEEITFDILIKFKDLDYLPSGENTFYNITITPTYTQYGDEDINLPEPDWLFRIEDNIVTAYNIDSSLVDDPTIVQIPEGVTEISENTFKNLPIKQVTFPQTLTTIGDNAFDGSKLDSVVITSNISGVGQNAFSNNPLKEMTLENCSKYCSLGGADDSVTSLVIEKGIIPKNAFSGKHIENLIIKNGVTRVDQYAFSEQKNFNNELIPIKNLTIENANVITYSNIFPNITNLTLEKGDVANSIFQNKEIKTLKLEEGIEYIGVGAFYNNQISGDIIIPSTVTSIKTNAFRNNFIENLNLDNVVNLQTIENYAFSSNLISELTIPSSVVSINSHAFNSNLIENLKLDNAVNLTKIGDYAFFNNLISGKLTISLNVEIIGDAAFENCFVEELDLNDAQLLNTIGANAFYKNQIDELTINENIMEINDSAFALNKITKLNLDSAINLIKIGSSTFNGNKISDLIIPKNLENLGYYSFSNNGMTSLKFEENSNLQSIPFRCFNQNLISGVVVLPNKLESIGRQAFDGNRIESLVLPSGIISIESRAFYNNKMKELNLNYATNLKNIGNEAFSNNQLNSLDFGNTKSLEIINDYAFYSAGLSGTLKLPDNLITLGIKSFANNKFESIMISKNLQSIGDGSFTQQNKSLKSIFIERDEESWNSDVTLGSTWYDSTLNPAFAYNYEMS